MDQKKIFFAEIKRPTILFNMKVRIQASSFKLYSVAWDLFLRSFYNSKRNCVIMTRFILCIMY